MRSSEKSAPFGDLAACLAGPLSRLACGVGYLGRAEVSQLMGVQVNQLVEHVDLLQVERHRGPGA